MLEQIREGVEKTERTEEKYYTEGRVRQYNHLIGHCDDAGRGSQGFLGLSLEGLK